MYREHDPPEAALAWFLPHNQLACLYPTRSVPPSVNLWSNRLPGLSQIARHMGPTWGPPGDDRTQVGPMLAPWTLLSGLSYNAAVADALEANIGYQYVVISVRYSHCGEISWDLGTFSVMDIPELTSMVLIFTTGKQLSCDWRQLCSNASVNLP